MSAIAQVPCYGYQPDLSVGTIYFSKGQAFLNGSIAQTGKQVRDGDTITTAADGYIAVEFGNDSVGSIQPGTHLIVDCSRGESLTHSTVNYKVPGPYMSGGTRG